MLGNDPQRPLLATSDVPFKPHCPILRSVKPGTANPQCQLRARGLYGSPWAIVAPTMPAGRGRPPTRPPAGPPSRGFWKRCSVSCSGILSSSPPLDAPTPVSTRRPRLLRSARRRRCQPTASPACCEHVCQTMCGSWPRPTLRLASMPDAAHCGVGTATPYGSGPAHPRCGKAAAWLTLRHWTLALCAAPRARCWGDTTWRAWRLAGGRQRRAPAPPCGRSTRQTGCSTTAPRCSCSRFAPTPSCGRWCVPSSGVRCGSDKEHGRPIVSRPRSRPPIDARRDPLPLP